MAAAILATVAFSNVPPNLLLIEGRLALVAAVVYVLSLAWLFVAPFDIHAHRAATVVGCLYWLGRGGGFASIVIHGSGDDRDSPTDVLWWTIQRSDLLGAVAERWSRGLGVVLWHTLSVAAIQLMIHCERVDDHR